MKDNPKIRDHALPFVTSRTRQLPPLHGLESCLRPRSCFGEASQLVVLSRSGLAQEVRDGCNSLAIEEDQLEAPGTRRGP